MKTFGCQTKRSMIPQFCGRTILLLYFVCAMKAGIALEEIVPCHPCSKICGHSISHEAGQTLKEPIVFSRGHYSTIIEVVWFVAI